VRRRADPITTRSVRRFVIVPKSLSRLFTARRLLTAAVLLAAVSAVADPSWARAAGLDVWNVRDLEQELETATRNQDRLTVEDATILNRIHVKEALIGDLIAGRVSLAEATAQFLAFNADNPGCVAVLRVAYPGDTDEERTAHNVMDYAIQRVANPAERAALASRLAAELVEMTHPGVVGY
jgi:hypothetical protein